ncbi:MAG: hypothetical protein Q9225_006185 [Loekoesia sp. 1 TL-2023]
MASSPSSFFTNLTSYLHQWPLLLPTLLTTYLTLTHLLRYRRLQTTTHNLNLTNRSSLSRMPISTAYHIHNYLISLEFPSIFSSATTFALFKTYGIPSVSSLLVHTNQIAGPPLTSSKRYADTGALLLEAVLNEPGSERSVEAIARINYLHDRWRGKGRIKDEDMLYTLSLFALEPMRWVRKYEWRELSEMEICAVGTLWKFLGESLKVPFELLPGYEKGWKDALEWIEEMDVWSRAYEERFMVPAESNGKLAEATLKIVLCKMPKFLHGFGRRVFATIMEKKLREAMLIEAPPPIYHKTFSLLITMRKFILRHLSLPRYRRLTRMPTPSHAMDGHFNLPKVRMHPWYIRPTFKKRWGPGALLTRLKGGVLPGDDEKFMPEGYLTKELGPMGLKGSGREEWEQEVRMLKEKGGSGCPFMGF